MSDSSLCKKTSPAGPEIVRLRTGSDQLDAILGGGFPASSINIVMGEPGSGKTILVERLMFANAKSGDRPILFMTTLSEPLDKVIRYLQQFDFYDESLLGETIIYESIGDDLVADGIDALTARLRQAIVAYSPQIIVIDSFKAIHDLSRCPAKMRLMLFEVAGLLTAFETTAFLIGEYKSEQVADHPEFAVADGMIQLTRNVLGHLDERFIRVLKLRGSAYEEGQHGFTISSAGIDVFPRLVSPSEAPNYSEQLERRLTTGVDGLDALMGGGITVGRSTFIVGCTGSGKTTFGLQFVREGLRQKQRCLHLSLEENPVRVVSSLRALGVDPLGAGGEGLQCMYVSPVELRIDRIVNDVFKVVHEQEISRVVVDAVGDLLAAVGSEHRLHAYLYALAQHFVVRGVTAFFLHEASELESASRLSALADNIIALGVSLEDRQASRWLRIIKSRGTQHDMHQQPLTIDGRGARIG